MSSPKPPPADLAAALHALMGDQYDLTEDPGYLPLADNGRPVAWGDASEGICEWCLCTRWPDAWSSDDIDALRGRMAEELYHRAVRLKEFHGTGNSPALILISMYLVADGVRTIADTSDYHLEQVPLTEFQHALLMDLKECYGIDWENASDAEPLPVVVAARSFASVWRQWAAEGRRADAAWRAP